MRSPECLLYTAKQAAEAGNFSESFIRKLIAKRLLQVVRVGRCVRIPRAALMRLCSTASRSDPEASLEIGEK